LSKGTANKSEKVLALLKDSTTRTYQEIANLVGCSDALVYVVSRENGLTRGIGRPRKTTAATQVKPAMTPAEIRAQAAKLLEEADRIENEQREKLRVQLKPTQDGKILIWMNGQGITGTHEQMNQLRVLLSAGIPTPFAGNEDAAMSQMFAATVAAGV